ncbi:MAG: hypothetical protein ACKO6N_17265 [Myxococcota bacterium]
MEMTFTMALYKTHRNEDSSDALLDEVVNLLDDMDYARHSRSDGEATFPKHRSAGRSWDEEEEEEEEDEDLEDDDYEDEDEFEDEDEDEFEDDEEYEDDEFEDDDFEDEDEDDYEDDE